MNAQSPHLPKCCVIGAGVSGLVTVKALRDKGIPVDVFEGSDRVGGVWAFDNPNGKSAAYRSLHIDTSRSRLELADYPMPADYPEYPHHTQIHRYLDSYADAFNLQASIKFGTSVDRAELTPNKLWRITTSKGEIKDYDCLFVCNGHHWDARWPEPTYPGSFSGEQIHAAQYRDPFDPIDMRGKRVLVVGMGNSAMDIASELSPRHISEKLFVSTRRGAYIFPRFMLGKAADKGKQSPYLPLSLQRALGRLIYRIVVGKMETYGLPKPDHRLYESHGTVSDDFPSRVAAGDIAMRGGIERFDGDHVVFSDGRRDKIDVIVWATGYKITFPFFDADFLAAKDNRLPLFKRVIKPGIDNLFFIGLMQSSITIFTPAELQAKWIAAYLSGEYAMPAPEEMQRRIVADEQLHNSRYYKSARHTMQIDQDIYFAEIEREMQAGRKRARRLGYGAGALPIQPRADTGAVTIPGE